MSTNKVAGNTASAAFKRVKPLLDRMRDDLQAVSTTVAKEYSGLPNNEKQLFAKKITGRYGWSQSRLKEFAKIGSKGPSKLKIITQTSAGGRLDQTNNRLMSELVSMDDTNIRKAAKAGLFDKPVTSTEMRLYKKTGRIPSDKLPTTLPKTDLQKIRSLMSKTDIQINNAIHGMNRILEVMENGDVIDAKGREATALIKSFEKLCKLMAAANPVTSKRAFAILRGEV